MPIVVRTYPVHLGNLKNMGRAVRLEVNGHQYKLWHNTRDYEALETEAEQLAADIGGVYVADPNWTPEAKEL